MNILVTGGAGFIASHIVDHYIDLGHRVTIVDNLSTGFKDNINPKAQWVQMDVCDPKLKDLFSTGAFDVVNHHAAQIDVRRSLLDPIEDARINILGTLNILNNCVAHKIKKVIYVSTAAVYGDPHSLPVREDAPIQAISPYGISKHTIEHYLQMYWQLYQLPSVAFRYPNVYGPRQNPKGEAGINAILIGHMLRGETPTIFGTGEQTRDYIHVQDIARANSLALTAFSQGHHVLNVSWGEEHSVNALYNIVADITGFKAKPNYAPLRPGEIARMSLDSQQIRLQWRWKPTISLRDGLKDTVEWFQQKGLKIFYDR